MQVPLLVERAQGRHLLLLLCCCWVLRLSLGHGVTAGRCQQQQHARHRLQMWLHPLLRLHLRLWLLLLRLRLLRLRLLLARQCLCLLSGPISSL